MRFDRLKSVRKLLQSHRCSHILVTDVVDVAYISGFLSSRVLLLISSNKNVLFTDFRYKEAAERFCDKKGVWKFVLIKEDDFSFLAPFLSPRSRIGFQSDVVTVDELQKMQCALPATRFVEIPQKISDCSISKTPPEIAAMTKAAGIGDRAFARFRQSLRPGITEAEAARLLERLCNELGSEKSSFDTIVLFGARSALPHGRPGASRLKKGDIVLVDFGCTVSGFCSDMTRTFCFGTASPRLRELYDVVQRANAAGRKAARPGITTCALDAVARTIIKEAGFGEAFGHGLGHGVGRRIHERPRVSAKTSDLLQVGSVVTIEPGIYIPETGGIRIEDMVVLTATGSRLLTHSPRDLFEAG